MQSSNPTVPSEVAANICIDILKPDSVTWRICSDKQENISMLQTKLNYNILAAKGGKKFTKKVIENFMLFNKKDANSEKNVKNWHWDSQKSWGNFCKNPSILQSPINILTSNIANRNYGKGIQKDSRMNFGIDYHFEEVPTVIKKHYEELFVHFMNYAGVLKYTVDNVNLVFQPQYLSFKFPGEHLIDGKRPEGEVLIHFTELNSNRKTWITNGLVVVIPLNPKKEHANLSFFENLNPDFWKLGIKKDGEYRPKKTLSKLTLLKLEKTPLKFSLDDLMRKATQENPKFYSYLGSQTTPPCTPNVVYLVLDKPLNLSCCQFKILRESSLMTTRPKEIHARLPQELKGRKVYELRHQEVRNTPKVRAYFHAALKKYKIYNKILKNSLGGAKAVKKCPSIALAGHSSHASPVARKASNSIMKSPYRPKTIKELNHHIRKLNKRAIVAMRKRGPNAKRERVAALAAIKAETESMTCS